MSGLRVASTGRYCNAKRTRSLAWIRRQPPKPSFEELTEIQGEQTFEYYNNIINWDEIRKNVKIIGSGKEKIRVEGDFADYMRKEKKPPTTNEKVIADYIRILDKWLSGKVIKSKEELREIVYSVDKGYNNFVKALRNLIHYLVSRDKLDRYVANDYLEILKVRETGVREIYPSNEDIQKAWEYIRQKWDEQTEMLFKFLVFTGIRLKHAYKVLKEFKPNMVEYYGDVAIIRIGWVSKGKKKGYVAVMPSKFAKKLKRLSEDFTYDMAESRLNVPENITNQKISSITVRKWADNFFVRNKIPNEISDFIQGRASLTVGSKNYLDKVNLAIDFYSEIVDKFPIPP
jgi:intergrase/recombinase